MSLLFVLYCIVEWLKSSLAVIALSLGVKALYVATAW